MEEENKKKWRRRSGGSRCVWVFGLLCFGGGKRWRKKNWGPVVGRRRESEEKEEGWKGRGKKWGGGRAWMWGYG